jgi:hypothetical protein
VVVLVVVVEEEEESEEEGQRLGSCEHGFARWREQCGLDASVRAEAEAS